MDAAYGQLLDDLAAESAQVRALLADLPDADWERPTPASRWAIRDQVSHLAYFDDAVVMAARDPERFRAEADALMARGEDFADVLAGDYRDTPPGRLRDWFTEARARMLDVFREVEPRTRMLWYGPPMSAMSSVTARLMETWAHGTDILEALGGTPVATPRLRHVAHLGVRTMGFSFTHHGLEAPEEPVAVRLDGPDGDEWRWGPDDAANVVSGPALDFCLVVTQRRHPADTALRVEGPVAAQWLSVAQAYAGPPAPGRPPRSAEQDPARAEAS